MIRSRSRAFVLIAVLVVVGSALYVATALLFHAQADVISARRSADVAQARALAWSGMQAVMSRLDQQRERLLNGGAPAIDQQYLIYERSGRAGMVRLIPMGAAVEFLVAEAGKLDLNSVEAAALENTGLVDADIAAAIVAFRDQQPGSRLNSVADLLRMPNAAVDARVLYGPVEEISTEDASALENRDLAQRVQRRLEPPQVRGLADVLTVYAFEPALQLNGKLRINLNVPWSDALAQRVEERFGPDAAAMAKQLFESGARFETESSIFQALRQYKTPPENWPQIIDAFTTDDGDFHYGRLNINAAAYEALRGLPGITPEQATQLVRVREELSDQERSTIAWPAIAQVVPPESYDALAGHITTRSWTFRLRLAAGEVDADEPDGPLMGRVVWEAVIDLSAPTPRIGYLRDITNLQSAAQIFAAASVRQPGDIEHQSARDRPENSASPTHADGAFAEESDSALDGSSEGEATSLPSRDGPKSPVQQSSSASKASDLAQSTTADRRMGRWRRGDHQ